MTAWQCTFRKELCVAMHKRLMTDEMVFRHFKDVRGETQKKVMSVIEKNVCGGWLSEKSIENLTQCGNSAFRFIHKIC